jgi:hypothetical protein
LLKDRTAALALPNADTEANADALAEILKGGWVSKMERAPLSLEHVAACLDWPDVDSLLAPAGGGPAVIA